MLKESALNKTRKHVVMEKEKEKEKGNPAPAL
jgi:hypothetical protein